MSKNQTVQKEYVKASPPNGKPNERCAQRHKRRANALLPTAGEKDHSERVQYNEKKREEGEEKMQARKKQKTEKLRKKEEKSRQFAEKSKQSAATSASDQTAEAVEGLNCLGQVYPTKPNQSGKPDSKEIQELESALQGSAIPLGASSPSDLECAPSSVSIEVKTPKTPAKGKVEDIGLPKLFDVKSKLLYDMAQDEDGAVDLSKFQLYLSTLVHLQLVSPNMLKMFTDLFFKDIRSIAKSTDSLTMFQRGILKFELLFENKHVTDESDQDRAFDPDSPTVKAANRAMEVCKSLVPVVKSASKQLSGDKFAPEVLKASKGKRTVADAGAGAGASTTGSGEPSESKKPYATRTIGNVDFTTATTLTIKREKGRYGILDQVCGFYSDLFNGTETSGVRRPVTQLVIQPKFEITPGKHTLVPEVRVQMNHPHVHKIKTTFLGPRQNVLVLNENLPAMLDAITQVVEAVSTATQIQGGSEPFTGKVELFLTHWRQLFGPRAVAKCAKINLLSQRKVDVFCDLLDAIQTRPTTAKETEKESEKLTDIVTAMKNAVKVSLSGLSSPFLDIVSYNGFTASGFVPGIMQNKVIKTNIESVKVAVDAANNPKPEKGVLNDHTAEQIHNATSLTQSMVAHTVSSEATRTAHTPDVMVVNAEPGSQDTFIVLKNSLDELPSPSRKADVQKLTFAEMGPLLVSATDNQKLYGYSGLLDHKRRFGYECTPKNTGSGFHTYVFFPDGVQHKHLRELKADLESLPEPFRSKSKVKKAIKIFETQLKGTLTIGEWSNHPKDIQTVSTALNYAFRISVTDRDHPDTEWGDWQKEHATGERMDMLSELKTIMEAEFRILSSMKESETLPHRSYAEEWLRIVSELVTASMMENYVGPKAEVREGGMQPLLSNTPGQTSRDLHTSCLTSTPPKVAMHVSSIGVLIFYTYASICLHEFRQPKGSKTGNQVQGICLDELKRLHLERSNAIADMGSDEDPGSDSDSDSHADSDLIKRSQSKNEVDEGKDLPAAKRRKVKSGDDVGTLPKIQPNEVYKHRHLFEEVVSTLRNANGLVLQPNEVSELLNAVVIALQISVGPLLNDVAGGHHDGKFRLSKTAHFYFGAMLDNGTPVLFVGPKYKVDSLMPRVHQSKTSDSSKAPLTQHRVLWVPTSDGTQTDVSVRDMTWNPTVFGEQTIVSVAALAALLSTRNAREVAPAVHNFSSAITAFFCTPPDERKSVQVFADEVFNTDASGLHKHKFIKELTIPTLSRVTKVIGASYIQDTDLIGLRPVLSMMLTQLFVVFIVAELHDVVNPNDLMGKLESVEQSIYRLQLKDQVWTTLNLVKSIWALHYNSTKLRLVAGTTAGSGAMSDDAFTYAIQPEPQLVETVKPTLPETEIPKCKSPEPMSGNPATIQKESSQANQMDQVITGVAKDKSSTSVANPLCCGIISESNPDTLKKSPNPVGAPIEKPIPVTLKLVLPTTASLSTASEILEKMCTDVPKGEEAYKKLKEMSPENTFTDPEEHTLIKTFLETYSDSVLQDGVRCSDDFVTLVRLLASYLMFGCLFTRGSLKNVTPENIPGAILGSAVSTLFKARAARTPFKGPFQIVVHELGVTPSDPNERFYGDTWLQHMLEGEDPNKVTTSSNLRSAFYTCLMIAWAVLKASGKEGLDMTLFGLAIQVIQDIKAERRHTIHSHLRAESIKKDSKTAHDLRWVSKVQPHIDEHLKCLHAQPDDVRAAFVAYAGGQCIAGFETIVAQCVTAQVQVPEP